MISWAKAFLPTKGRGGTVARLLLQRQQVVDSLFDQFARLDEELLDELVHPAAPQSMAAYSARASCCSGLTR